MRLLPGDGRCSSRVSASSERRTRVLLIGDAAGSPPLFLFLAQEPSYIDASSRDLKTFGQDITCKAFVIFGGLRGVGDFSGRAPLSAVSMRLWSEYLQKLQVSSEALHRVTSNIQECLRAHRCRSCRVLGGNLPLHWPCDGRCAAPVLAAPSPVCVLRRNRLVWIMHVGEVEKHATGGNSAKLGTAWWSDFQRFAVPRHPCPSSSLSPSDPHARSVLVALAAVKSEGYKPKDLTGFPRLIYAAPGLNPLRRTSTRWRGDWDLDWNNGEKQTFLPFGIILLFNNNTLLTRRSLQLGGSCPIKMFIRNY